MDNLGPKLFWYPPKLKKKTDMTCIKSQERLIKQNLANFARSGLWVAIESMVMELMIPFPFVLKVLIRYYYDMIAILVSQQISILVLFPIIFFLLF